MRGRPWLTVLLIAVPLLAAIVVGVTTISVDPAEAPVEPPEVIAADQRELGDELFSAQCSSCHGLDGSGVEDRGPSLLNAGEAAADFVLRTGRMPIAAPGIQTRSGPVRFDEEEILALVAHVGMLGDGPAIPEIDTTDADVGNGGRLYRLNCAACHVASGAGAPIGSNRRAPNLMRATPTEIGEAMLVGPGAMPAFTSLSPDDFKDITAYIEHLQDQDTTSALHLGGAGPAAEGLAAWLLALVPLIALTRWIGSPKDGRDRPLPHGTDGDEVDPDGEAAAEADRPTTDDVHEERHEEREDAVDVR